MRGNLALLALILYFDGMTKLTPRQAKFVEEYLIHRSAAEAYRVAYSADRMRPSSVWREGHRLLNHPKLAPIITERLNELGQVAETETEFTVIQALGLFLDLARADPNELIGLRVGCCRKCWGDGFNFQWRTEQEWMEACAKAEKAGDENFPLPDGGFGFDHTKEPNGECPYCRGEGETRIVPMDTRNLSPGGKMLYQGVKQTKDGLQIILADKAKALENATKLIGGFLERVELSGGVSVAKPDLTGLSASDASAKYADFVKGSVDRTGKKG